jgi:hypothetical protein
MAYIELSGKRGRGKKTLVDESTLKKYGHLAWHLSDTGYVVRRTSEGTVRLHRLVANTPEGMFTDHKNHNRLDNRESNLRVVTQAENMSNYKGAKGYAWDKSKQKWIVRYRHKFYGRYTTESEAKKAYQLACSGVEYVGKPVRRRKYLPKGVLYMKNMRDKPFYIRPQINGKRFFQGYFSTVQEAEDAYIKFMHKED